jgi:hypothetical protein
LTAPSGVDDQEAAGAAIDLDQAKQGDEEAFAALGLMCMDGIPAGS